MDIIKILQSKSLYRKYWYVLASAVIAAAVLVLARKYRNVSFIAAEESLLTDTVQRGPMPVSVRGDGKLVAKNVSWIVAKAQGQVEKISVKAGDRRKHGDVLC